MLDAIEKEDDVIVEYLMLTVIQEHETIEEFYW